MFIYPDFSTVIYGQFQDNGVLISGRQVALRDMSYFGNSMLITLQVSDEFGPTFVRDIAKFSLLSKNPLLRDPYESKFVDIKTSKIPGISKIYGEGVFLKKNVISGTVVSYFNGVKLEKKNAFSWNPFKEKSVFLIDFEDDEGKEIFLDIPEEFVKSSKYNATSGHKVC